MFEETKFEDFMTNQRKLLIGDRSVKIEKEIGRESFGFVYRGVIKNPEKRVAVKIFIKTTEDVIKSFDREVQCLLELERYAREKNKPVPVPGLIMHQCDFFVEGKKYSHPIIVLEYLGMNTLDFYI